MCDPEMYDDEIARLALYFSDIILDDFHGIKDRERDEGEQRRSNMKRRHITELCEACMDGVCKKGKKKSHTNNKVLVQKAKPAKRPKTI